MTDHRLNKSFVRIGDRKVGFGRPAFVVAELSANHRHDFNLAVKTIQAAKKAGADAIKLQTYTPDTMTVNCQNRRFRVGKNTLWAGKSLYQLYQEAYTPWEWHARLKRLAENLGLVFFSTPFDKSATDFLEQLKVPVYKIASLEIVDIPLIEYVAKKGKPMMISTGIATLNDVREAVNACKRVGNNQIVLLKCTSSYPTPLEEANLRSMEYLAKKFRTVVGISDHTMGTEVSVAAVALGAKVVERHFIYDRKVGGPDAAFSLEPLEFKSMVQSIRKVETAMGCWEYKRSKSMKDAQRYARSLFAVQDIEKGKLLTADNVKSIRPGGGLQPIYLTKVLHKEAKVHIKKGTPLQWKMILQ